MHWDAPKSFKFTMSRTAQEFLIFSCSKSTSQTGRYAWRIEHVEHGHHIPSLQSTVPFGDANGPLKPLKMV